MAIFKVFQLILGCYRFHTCKYCRFNFLYQRLHFLLLSTMSSRDHSQAPPTTASSKHTSDPILLPFLSSSFNPASYLNDSLPSLTTPSTSTAPPRTAQQQQTTPPSISELSNQIQSLLSHLTVQNARLSAVLTQLTDDILRTGGRLSYEVDLLRGETRGLVELLLDRLTPDLETFLSEPFALTASDEHGVSGQTNGADNAAVNGTVLNGDTPTPLPAELDVPDYIIELQTLTLLRNRLESVTKTFGTAMEWVMPPSEMTFTSSFISVSAPDPTSESQSQEEKGQEVSKRIKDEIQTLLNSSSDPSEGIMRVRKRIEELQELAMVWNGTMEEKPRQRLIDGLIKTVGDKERSLDVIAATPAVTATPTRTKEETTPAAESGRFGLGGFGLINQLQKIREGR